MRGAITPSHAPVLTFAHVFSLALGPRAAPWLPQTLELSPQAPTLLQSAPRDPAGCCVAIGLSGPAHFALAACAHDPSAGRWVGLRPYGDLLLHLLHARSTPEMQPHTMLVRRQGTTSSLHTSNVSTHHAGQEPRRQLSMC